MDRKLVGAVGVVLVVLLGASVYRTQQSLQAYIQDVILYDQLSTVYSPIEFREGISEYARSKEWEMEYYNTSEVTVDLLKQPPKTQLLILRLHSGVFDEGVWLFTGEGYSESRHALDQVRGNVHMARCSSTSGVVFAVGEDFIEENWVGLGDTLVILMGCEGMGSESMAKVLVGCGARGVVGWDNAVTLQTSDKAVLELVVSLGMGEELGSIMDRINTESKEAGRLVYYPDSLIPYVFPG